MFSLSRWLLQLVKNPPWVYKNMMLGGKKSSPKTELPPETPGSQNEFPFGFWPPDRCELLVSGRVTNVKIKTTKPKIAFQKLQRFRFLTSTGINLISKSSWPLVFEPTHLENICASQTGSFPQVSRGNQNIWNFQLARSNNHLGCIKPWWTHTVYGNPKQPPGM